MFERQSICWDIVNNENLCLSMLLLSLRWTAGVFFSDENRQQTFKANANNVLYGSVAFEIGPGCVVLTEEHSNK